MASKTFLGRDICVGYWGLVLSGYFEAHARSTPPVHDPLRQWVLARSDAHAALLAAVARYSGLESALTEPAARDAPWADGTDWGSEEESVGEMSLLSGRLVRFDEIGDVSACGVVLSAARSSMRRLMDALMGAVYAFGERDAPVRSSIGRVLALLGAVVPEGAVREVIAQGHAEWLAEVMPMVIAHPETNPGYRAWLVDAAAK